METWINVSFYRYKLGHLLKYMLLIDICLMDMLQNKLQ